MPAHPNRLPRRLLRHTDAATRHPCPAGHPPTGHSRKFPPSFPPWHTTPLSAGPAPGHIPSGACRPPSVPSRPPARRNPPDSRSSMSASRDTGRQGLPARLPSAGSLPPGYRTPPHTTPHPANFHSRPAADTSANTPVSSWTGLPYLCSLQDMRRTTKKDQQPPSVGA